MIFCFNAAEVFQVAIEIKENGRAFYEKAQNIVQNPEVQKLFADLAREEVEHKNKIANLTAGLPSDIKSPTVADSENELEVYVKAMADQHVFRSCGALNVQLDQIKDAQDALRLALQFEKDSVIFFLGMQEATCEGRDRDVINLLLKEEQIHVRRLSLQMQRMGYCRI
ncbi:MAG: ferritin family protein [Desulfobacteraceae bacterium]|nr:ferritin family protein [Desulfobacteraceae bacterium]